MRLSLESLWTVSARQLTVLYPGATAVTSGAGSLVQPGPTPRATRP
jgi:hypothetical protein